MKLVRACCMRDGAARVRAPDVLIPTLGGFYLFMIAIGILQVRPAACHSCCALCAPS